jgi:hypothetical protein
VGAPFATPFGALIRYANGGPGFLRQVASASGAAAKMQTSRAAPLSQALVDGRRRIAAARLESSKWCG